MGDKCSIRKKKLNGVQILSLGFIVVISIGALLLTLPIATVNGESTSLVDAYFTSTSAVCVTGLITVDTGTHWNMFGQTVIMLLIEVGGLGFMSLTTFIAILIGKKITLRERLLIQESVNAFNIQGLVKMVKHIVIFTIIVQLSGALILSFTFIPDFGVGKGIYYSIFHSVSAFCNAGFDILGNFSSLTGYYDNSILLLTMSALIIIGGLGFAVWLDIYHFKMNKKLKIHSKIVILITLILLIGGTLAFFALEYNNPDTLGSMNLKDKGVNAFFAAVTPRTAGFNSISTDGMTNAGKYITILLMFIGGSPGSTAGGLKTTTFGLILLTVISVIRGREDTEVFGRRFAKELVYRAFALFFIAMMLVIGVTLVLSITEPNEKFIDLLYEATSAFGTAGITTGVTQRVSLVGKIILMITMYLGRVGPLTVVFALTNKKSNKSYKYPEGKILIG